MKKKTLKKSSTGKTRARTSLDPDQIPGFVLQNTLAIEALTRGLHALAVTLTTYIVWVHATASRSLSNENTQALLNQIDDMRSKL